MADEVKAEIEAAMHYFLRSILSVMVSENALPEPSSEGFASLLSSFEHFYTRNWFVDKRNSASAVDDLLMFDGKLASLFTQVVESTKWLRRESLTKTCAWAETCMADVEMRTYARETLGPWRKALARWTRDLNGHPPLPPLLDLQYDSFYAKKLSNVDYIVSTQPAAFAKPDVKDGKAVLDVHDVSTYDDESKLRKMTEGMGGVLVRKSFWTGLVLAALTAKNTTHLHWLYTGGYHTHIMPPCFSCETVWLEPLFKQADEDLQQYIQKLLDQGSLELNKDVYSIFLGHLKRCIYLPGGPVSVGDHTRWKRRRRE